jgi:hypothetical protein
MDLKEVACELGLEDYCDAFAEGWEEAQAARPTEVFFLAPEFIAEAADWCALPEAGLEAAQAAATRIAESPALTALAWYLHYCLYRLPGFDRERIYAWPPLPALQTVLGEDAGMPYLLALISGLPHVREYHRAHGVPEEVTRATLAQVRLFVEGGKEETGNWGFWGADRPGWLIRHFRGDLFRLGRLQFECGQFIGGVVMFRHQGSGKVLALAEAGVRFMEDGRLWTAERDPLSPPSLRSGGTLPRAAGESEEPDLGSSWTADLSITSAQITGHVVTVTAHARRETVALAAREWRQVLAKGDPVLHLHIPSGGPMDHTACGESFAWAERFFPEHFPERPFLAYCCNSWLLDTQLAEFVPPESNMARFQREMYLFQTITNDDNLLRPIYGLIPQFQPSPRNTSLQRALSDFLEAGGELRASGGGSIILREDLDWGGEVYRRGRADERALEG